MEQKNYDIVLDIENDLYTPSNLLFDVSQNDLDSIQLNFSITKDGGAFDLTGTTVELAVKKPSGLTTYTSAEVTDEAGGLATITLPLQSYVEYGIYKAEVNVRVVDKMAVTCPFYYSVREAIMNTTEIESINDWTALQQALFAYDLKPILVDGVPTAVPEYVGQTAFDTTGKRAFIANALSADSWQLLSVGEGGTGIVSWADILAKPTTFAPSAHTHTIDDVTGLSAALDGKADDADLLPFVTLAEADARYEAIGTEVDLTEYLRITDADDTYQPLGDYLTTAEGDARYEPIGTTPDMTGYLTEAEGDGRYLPITKDLFTQAEADARYQGIGTDTPDDWAEITGKPATFPPSPHVHVASDITDFAQAVANDIPADYMTQAESDARYALRDATGGTVQSVDWGTITGTLANQTDLQNALNTKADADAIPDTTGFITETDADARYLPVTTDLFTQAEADARYLASTTDLFTQTEADARYQAIGTDTPDDWADITGKPTEFPPAAHVHTIADVTGLQGELDAKANTTDIPDTTGFITGTDADARYQQIGTDTPDDWADITGKPATFPPSAHQHTTADITDFAGGVAGAIPAEYLTQTEGDARYLASTTDLFTQAEADARYLASTTDLFTQAEADALYEPIGSTPDMTGYLTETAGDARYQAIGTDTPDDWADITGKPATFPPSAHQHTSADVTDFATAVRTTGDAAYQAKGTYLTSVPLMSGASVGGAQVGNGLAMSGNYLYAKLGAGLGLDTGTNSIQVMTSDATPAPLKFWVGIQADYDAIASKDANTLYFITG